MINLNNVSKIFKSDLLTQPFVALKEVSFNIPEGSMIGFLGANGAGKTTTLKIIMDFIKPTSGEINFSEKLGKSREEILKNIGFLPERPYFYPNLTGNDFVYFMGKLSGMKRVEITRHLEILAPRFRIDHALKRELKTYSKGMLQRIGFLTTIIHQPKIVILDEPLSGLDPIGRKELKDVIIDLHKDGKTVFFSTHIVPDVEEVCDRVVFLKEGKLAYDGSVSSLINQASTKEVIIKFYSEKSQNSLLQGIEIENLPDSLKRIIINESHKNEVLAKLLHSEANIISLENAKLNLEDIFYKLKK